MPQCMGSAPWTTPRSAGGAWHEVGQSIRDSHAYIFLTHTNWAIGARDSVRNVCGPVSPRSGAELLCNGAGAGAALAGLAGLEPGTGLIKPELPGLGSESVGSDAGGPGDFQHDQRHRRCHDCQSGQLEQPSTVAAMLRRRPRLGRSYDLP